MLNNWQRRSTQFCTCRLTSIFQSHSCQHDLLLAQIIIVRCSVIFLTQHGFAFIGQMIIEANSCVLFVIVLGIVQRLSIYKRIPVHLVLLRKSTLILFFRLKNYYSSLIHQLGVGAQLFAAKTTIFSQLHLVSFLFSSDIKIISCISVIIVIQFVYLNICRFIILLLLLLLIDLAKFALLIKFIILFKILDKLLRLLLLLLSLVGLIS